MGSWKRFKEDYGVISRRINDEYRLRNSSPLPMGFGRKVGLMAALIAAARHPWKVIRTAYSPRNNSRRNNDRLKLQQDSDSGRFY